MAVNGHGITSDYCLAESVVRFTLVKADGSVEEVERSNELFGLVLGGYGLFGIVFEATLRVDDNVRLSLDTMALPLADFPHVYERVLNNGSSSTAAAGSGSGEAEVEAPVQMKLGRVDITTFDTAELFVFTRDAPTPSVGRLSHRPREMSAASRLMYKWLAGPLREARFALERNLGVALDWSTGVTDRNEMLFESAEPLAKLYSPLVTVDDTFVLQEFFVPRERFGEWVAAAKPVITESLPKETLVTLLNCTIRFVHQDTDSALPYARHPTGCYAFVLYYRLRRTPDADAVLRRYHAALAAPTLKVGGTFYLPYRHHYTDAELAAAYPGLAAFAEAKARHDPSGVFSNLWWDRYAPEPPRRPKHVAVPCVWQPAPASPSEEEAASMPLLMPPVRSRRKNSFRSLMASPRLRSAFFEGFLQEVFNLMPAAELRRLISAACWDSRLEDDDAIYTNLRAAVAARSSSPLSQLSSLWAGVKQLSEQKRELTRETVALLARLGKVGQIHSLVSVGDHGKLVLPLRAALGMRGPVWVVHDSEAPQDDTPAVLERGAMSSADVGTFVRIDYNDVVRGRPLAAIPEGAADLVTMNQGLHHLVPSQLPSFLAAIARVLRPGGVLIVREHDLDAPDAALLPMLNCAHAVFNAVTGVAPEAEAQEVRAFRPLLQWRAIVEGCSGLVDSRLYEMQPHDPTADMMMAFVKTPVRAVRDPGAAPLPLVKAPVQHGTTAAAQMLLNQVPGLTIELATGTLEKLLRGLPWLRGILRQAVDTQLPNTPGLRSAASMVLQSYVEPAITMLERFRPLAGASRPITDAGDAALLPSELFLLEPAIRARAAKGGAMEAALIGLLDKMYDSGKATQAGSGGKKPGAPAPASGSASPDASGSEAGVTVEEVSALLAGLRLAIPVLNDPEATVDGMGLPGRAASLARTALVGGGADGDKLAILLAGILDRRGWEALTAAAPAVHSAGEPPTLAAMSTPGSPWSRFASAVLGCPAVQLTRMQVMVMDGMGMGGLTQLWAAAQVTRKKTAAQVAAGGGTSSAATAQVPRGVLRALDFLCPLRSYEGPAADISGVLSIVSASIEARSLTKLLADVSTDITTAAQAQLDPAIGTLRLGAVERPTQLRLGTHVYRVTYRPLPSITAAVEGDSKPGARYITALGRALADAGAADGVARSGNALLNIYKLPEWLQVEAVQLFAQSMEHTPWFRYPFGQVARVYAGVLGQAVSQAVAEGGLGAALTSEGFVTDVVPALVMGVIGAQLAALAAPLRWALGDENWDSNEVEELILAAPPNTKWGAVDARIRDPRSPTPGVWVMTVPTFKPLTDVLIRVATSAPAAVLLQLSTHTRVHVKLGLPARASANPEDWVDRLTDAVPGVSHNYTFRMPPVGGRAQPPQASLSVATTSLLQLLRTASSEGLPVQVYDFNGSS